MQTCPTCKAEVPPFLLACPTCAPEKLQGTPPPDPAVPVPRQPPRSSGHAYEHTFGRASAAPAPAAPVPAPVHAPPLTIEPARGFPWKILVGLGIAVAGIVLVIVVVAMSSRPELLIVNNSKEETITVLVDDEIAAKEVSRAPSESQSKVARVKISSGPHHLVARDATGNTIHEVWVEIDAKHNLYAPAHAKDTCFVIEKASSWMTGESYGTDEELARGESFWRLPDGINKFFEPTAGTGKRSWALRQETCRERGDPDALPAGTASPKSTAPWPLYTPPRPTATPRPTTPRKHK